MRARLSRSAGLVADDFVKPLQMIDFLPQVLVLGPDASREPIDLGAELVERRLLFRAKHGRRHAFRDEAQRLHDVCAQGAG